MKRYALFIAPILAVTVIACCISFSAGFRFGKLIAVPTAVADPRTIGSACTMQDATFGPEVITGGEKTAWYWRDSQGHFCADMHHVHNPDIGMDDWRSVYAIGIGSKAVFEHEADAVQWVESQPFRQGGAK